MGSTVNECFLEVVERRGDGVAFLVKRDGAWRSFSYDWALEQVRRTAFGLRSLGYERGTRFAVLSENRPEWATTDYGAIGGLHPQRRRSAGSVRFLDGASRDDPLDP